MRYASLLLPTIIALSACSSHSPSSAPDRDALFADYITAVEAERQCVIDLGYEVSEVLPDRSENRPHFNYHSQLPEPGSPENAELEKCWELSKEAGKAYLSALVPVDDTERAELWTGFVSCARGYGVTEDLSGKTDYEVATVLFQHGDSHNCMHQYLGLFPQLTGVGDPERTIVSTGKDR